MGYVPDGPQGSLAAKIVPGCTILTSLLHVLMAGHFQGSVPDCEAVSLHVCLED